MLAQVVVDEGEGSEQPTPSPTQPSIGDQPPMTESSYSPDTTQHPRVNLEGTGVICFCTNLSNPVLALETSKGAQAAKILKLKTRIKKLKRKCQPVISHHKAWLRSVSRLSMKKKLGKKESVSKQGRKNAKSGPKLDDSAFDDLDADLAHGMDDMETEEAVNEGRQSNETEELNLDADTEVIAEDKGSGEKQEIGTADPTTPPTTTTIFDDEEMTLADTLVKMKDNKAKGVVARDEKVARQLEVELQAEWNKRTLEEIKALYIKEQESAINFVPIVSEEDERLIQKMNKKAAGVHVEKVLEQPNSTKVEVKKEAAEHGTRKTPGKVLRMKARKKARKPTHADSDNEHNYKKDEKNKKDAVESSEKGIDASKKRKGGPRMKRQSKRKKTDFDLEEEEHLKTFLKIVPDEEGIIDFEVLEKRFPIINWESKFYYFDIHGEECIYYRIFRSDGSSRWIKTFSEMVTRTMFEANAEDELWQNQEGWNLKSWDFYENYGVHTLTLQDGTKIHMLAERRYPLTKETLERMVSLKLIAESASDSAYDLLRFIQKQIDEAGSHDGGEKDL
ncbi:hypothetical protein Tco_0289456 [Tanacetum coccineum]